MVCASHAYVMSWLEKRYDATEFEKNNAIIVANVSAALPTVALGTILGEYYSASNPAPVWIFILFICVALVVWVWTVHRVLS